MSERPPLPRHDKPLFFASFEVDAHIVKKNGRPIWRGRLGKSPRLKHAEIKMQLGLQNAKRLYSFTSTLDQDLHACFRFYFDDFYTAKLERRKNMPDLSNLLELPQDCLQVCHIIKNDTQIVSLDGSRRLPGPRNLIEIWLWSAL